MSDSTTEVCQTQQAEDLKHQRRRKAKRREERGRRRKRDGDGIKWEEDEDDGGDEEEEEEEKKRKTEEGYGWHLARLGNGHWTRPNRELLLRLAAFVHGFPGACTAAISGLLRDNCCWIL